MGEDISDAKTQPIQDGTNPNFSNVDAGTDGTELGVNKRDKTSLFTESASDEANLYTQKKRWRNCRSYIFKTHRKFRLYCRGSIYWFDEIFQNCFDL